MNNPDQQEHGISKQRSINKPSSSLKPIRLVQASDEDAVTQKMSAVEQRDDITTQAYKEWRKRIEKNRFRDAMIGWLSKIKTRKVPAIREEDRTKEPTMPLRIVQNGFQETEEKLDYPRYVADQIDETNASNIRLRTLIRDDTFVPKFVPREKTFHEKQVSLVQVLSELHISRRDLRREANLYLSSQGAVPSQSLETAFATMKYVHELPLMIPGQKALLLYYLLRDVYQFPQVRLAQGTIRVNDPDGIKGKNTGPAIWMQWKLNSGEEYYLDVENTVGIRDIKTYPEFVMRRGGFQKVNQDETIPRVPKIKVA